jgi:hypothetical protein
MKAHMNKIITALTTRTSALEERLAALENNNATQ